MVKKTPQKTTQLKSISRMLDSEQKTHFPPEPITIETVLNAAKGHGTTVTEQTYATTALDDSSLYINRELSLLQFNYRVLAQAIDDKVPLLERLKFLAICSNNLDEFFEIRVAGLKRNIVYDSYQVNADGMPARELMEKISLVVHEIVSQQYRILNEHLIPMLEKEDIYFVDETTWTNAQANWIEHYFTQELLPVLSPIGLDLAHPFPRLINKSLNFIFELKGKDAFGRDSGLAVMQAPRALPRVIRLPKSTSKHGDHFVLLSSIIKAHAKQLFPGMKVKGCYQFRLTRNSDLSIDEVTDDLAHALKGELFARRYGDAVRLEVADDCPESIVLFLQRKFGLHDHETYLVNGPVNLSRLFGAYSAIQKHNLLYPALKTLKSLNAPISGDIFELLRKEDILLHHPYQSFNLVVDFIKQAATDPNVLAIRQTLYRTGHDSVMVKSLIDAAKMGKEVTAVIELRARFDEADNIELARCLQEAGALVVYGVVEYKTHAKMSLVIRREGRHLTRYAHLGTGNYHTGNARQYTDFGLMTCNKAIGEDVHNVFQLLTGMGKVKALNKLLHAPFTLHSDLLQLIDAEIAAASKGQDGHIIFKVNSIAEQKIIIKLYEASQAGVKIDLIVRGVCCLRPGIPGVSENITVRSIVGRFLEHSRIYYFGNLGNPKVYCSSADFLERNFFHRVETCFPIESPKLIKRVVEEGLKVYLKDNTQSWLLNADGHYVKNTSKETPAFSAQAYLLETL